MYNYYDMCKRVMLFKWHVMSIFQTKSAKREINI